MKRLPAIAAAALAIVTAGSGLAQTATNRELTSTVVLSQGERITFEVLPDGRLNIVKRELAQKDFGLPVPGATALVSTAPAGQVVASLAYDTTSGGTVLKVESGLDYGFEYNAAVMVQVNGVARMSPAPVCTIVRSVVGFQSWRQPINVMTLKDFKPHEGGPDCPAIDEDPLHTA